MASLVDPRFKTAYIKEERVDYMKAKAAAELESLVAEEAASLPSAAAARDESEVPAKRQKKSLSSYYKKSSKAKANGPSVKQRVHCKGAQPLSSTGGWSRDKPTGMVEAAEAHFQLVAKLANKYLCIPATSAPSERAFSTSGKIVTCQSSSLKSERVDQLVFLALNL